MSTVWMASVLGLALAGEPSPRATATEPAAEAATSDARPSPFVQVGLGGGLVLARFYHERRYTTGGPTFGVEAGAVWNPLRRLRLGIGGALTQTGYVESFSSASSDLLAKARIGVGTPRVWGYGIVGAGLSVVIRDIEYTADPEVGPAALAGLGVRGRVGRRVSLGFEVESAIAGRPPIGRVTRVSGLLVIAIQFGP
jgi:hypothetical protein